MKEQATAKAVADPRMACTQQHVGGSLCRQRSSMPAPPAAIKCSYLMCWPHRLWRAAPFAASPTPRLGSSLHGAPCTIGFAMGGFLSGPRLGIEAYDA
jgi:hypothetical protein